LQSGLKQSIKYLKGVGPQRSKIIGRLGIHTIEDILYYFPRDYKDYSKIQNISESITGTNVSIQGKIKGIKNRTTRSGKSILEVFVYDETGIIAATWFNQPFLVKKFRVGDTLLLHGRVGLYRYLQLLNPEYETFHADYPNNTPGLIPVYSLTEGISQNQFRKIMNVAVQHFVDFIDEIIPKHLIKKYSLLSARDAIRNIHFPASPNHLKNARRSLVYEELFVLETAIALKKYHRKKEYGISFKTGPNVDAHIRNLIPFTLTNAQERAIGEIKKDMKSTIPMNRLLQGDVGSGKTVVALYASLIAIANGYQTAFMAPTEILAHQHFLTLQSFLQQSHVKISLVTGNIDIRKKKIILEHISSGETELIVGTHALIEQQVAFKNLGLVIIDEQHKFGVIQRMKLRKKGISPDVLVMTATPIPRTLSLTLFGDMDVSLIDEIPPGRLPVKTFWVPKNKENKAYDFIRGEIQKGKQVFIVYPLVEESEKLDLKAAIKEAHKLQNEVFPDTKVGVLHGKMAPTEKEQVMSDFKNKKYHILVSTVIIEVGIDIPDATIMAIEHAERFGLPQLHQLRGRIGRGGGQSYCLLLGNPVTASSRERLKAMVQNNDGFKIAEIDYRLRGPGEFFGTRQHGMPELKISDLVKDISALKCARRDAFELVDNDPYLISEENKKIRQKVKDAFQDKSELFTTG